MLTTHKSLTAFRRYLSFTNATRRGSALAYILFVALLIAVSIVSMLNNLGNEISICVTHRNRAKATYAAEAAVELCAGRLQLRGDTKWDGGATTPRWAWESSLFNQGGLYTATINGCNVAVQLENVQGKTYNTDSYPMAFITATATGADGQTIVVRKEFKEANTADFAQFWPASSALMPSGLDPKGGITLYYPAFPCKAKNIYYLTGGDSLTFDATYGGVTGSPPYFSGESILVGSPQNNGVFNATGIRDAALFPGGWRKVNDWTHPPMMDTDILRSAQTMAASTGDVYTVTDPSNVFQIRIRAGGTYQYRQVRNQFNTSTPWSARIPVPQNSVILIKDDSYCGHNNPWEDGGLLLPRTRMDHDDDNDMWLDKLPTGAPNGTPEEDGCPDCTGGVQVWVDTSGTWQPSVDAATPTLGNMTGRTTQVSRLAQGNTKYDGRFTIASEGNIEIMGSLEAKDFTNDPATGDMLGLIARNTIYFRNDTLQAPTYPNFTSSNRIQKVDAFMVAQRGGIMAVYNWFTDPYYGQQSRMAPGITFRGTRYECTWDQAVTSGNATPYISFNHLSGSPAYTVGAG